MFKMQQNNFKFFLYRIHIVAHATIYLNETLEKTGKLLVTLDVHDKKSWDDVRFS